MNECTGRRSPLRVRVGVVILVAVAGALFVLAGCGGLGSPGRLDARFLATVRAEGHDVPRGAEGEATLVTAAHKICDRRAFHATVAQRRQSALTPDELATITRTFAGDAPRFAALALDTYCS